MWTLCFLYWHLLFSRNFPKNITCSTFLQDCFCDYDWESWNFFYPSLLGQSGRSQTSSTWVNASVLRTSQVIRRKIEHIIREQTALVIGMLVHKDCKSWGVTHSYFVDEEKSWNRIWFFSRNQSFFRHSIYQYHILDDWLCKKTRGDFLWREMRQKANNQGSNSDEGRRHKKNQRGELFPCGY